MTLFYPIHLRRFMINILNIRMSVLNMSWQLMIFLAFFAIGFLDFIGKRIFLAFR